MEKTRNNLVLCTSILMLFVILSFDVPGKGEFKVFLSEGIPIHVSAQLDDNKLLDYYKADVFTPVCDDTLCYPVELVMYWDPIGRFSHYDTIKGKGLTKMDHEPFTQADYRKLFQLLQNRYPSFYGLKKDELIGQGDAIDGYSGATNASVKDDAIEGAIYSCYTLWHIAQGAINDSIQQITPHYFCKELIGKFARQKDEQITRYLLDHFAESDFSTYMPEICDMMNNGGAYFAKNIIEKIPESLFDDPELQQTFAGNYHWLHEYAQMSLLQKLSGKKLSEALLKELESNMDRGDSEKNARTQAILLENKN